MSADIGVKLIEELPDVLVSKCYDQFFDVYCYVLYIEKPLKGPLRLFVSDFTSNKHIANPGFPKDIELDGRFAINDDQILRIDAFPDRQDQLKKLYVQQVGNELEYDMNLAYDSTTRRYYVHERIWIIKATISLKKYNEITEARMKNVSSVNIFDKHKNLAELYMKFGQLPPSFLHRNRQRIQDSMPSTYATRLLAYPTDHDTEINSNTNSNSNCRYSSQPAQNTIKTESLSDEIVPDTLFESDYANTSSPPVDLEAQREVDVSPNLSLQSTDYCTLKELNENYGRHIDNKIYKIQGYIIGSIPQDWSQICIKSYEYCTIISKHELTDPFIRHLELIITDVNPSTNEEVILTSDNSITVHLDSDQIHQLLNIKEVEHIYTQINKVNNKFYKDNHKKLINLDVYKKKVKINEEEELIVWTTKNLTIDDLD